MLQGSSCRLKKQTDDAEAVPVLFSFLMAACEMQRLPSAVLDFCCRALLAGRAPFAACCDKAVVLVALVCQLASLSCVVPGEGAASAGQHYSCMQEGLLDLVAACSFLVFETAEGV